MRLRPSLLAATALAGGLLATAAVPAAAQPVQGLYIGAGAGANWLQSPTDVSLPQGFGLPNNVEVNNAGKIEFKTGWGVVTSIGWGFGNGLRAEIEGNYRSNAVDDIKGFPGLSPFGSAAGFQSTYGVMANVFYDFDFASFGLGQSIFQPYIGVGVGYAWTNWRNVRTVSLPTGLSLNSDGTEGGFAYQAILGVGTPLTWLGVRGLTLTTEFRFLGTVEPQFNASWRTPTGQIVSGGKFEPQNFNYGVFVGVRYALFQPPPPQPAPPPVAPAPTLARTYLVFFDWDRADLTERARQIIAEAAQNSRALQTTRIEVAGHADRSGTPQYNQRLSQRRADVVAAELVRNGVGRDEIAITAYGETRPLVPTADGVREPQNRRVEIVLR